MKILSIAANRYHKELQEINLELATLPEGSLSMKRNSYYQIINRKQICITKNPPLIKMLRRKIYLLVRKKQIEHNLKAESVGELDMRLPQELIASLSKPYSKAPITHFYHPKTVKWLKKLHPTNTLHPERAVYTYKDINFRLLAERIIAEEIDHLQLIYQYDVRLTLAERQISPDFIIINPYNHETYILEHYGLGEKNYINNMNDKMDFYLTSQIVPFENLMSTYEYHIRKPERIRNLIEKTIF